MDSPLRAKRREIKLIKITENLVSQRKPLSERFLNIGLRRFSLRIAEGARMAELDVLIMADSSAPKKSTFVSVEVCSIINVGSMSWASSFKSSGYFTFAKMARIRGIKAIVRYIKPAVREE